MNAPLQIEVSELAAEQIGKADAWWRANRPKAPNAIREELERATSLISVHPRVGTRARNVTLSDVRRLHIARIHYDIYYRMVDSPERIEFLAFGHSHRGKAPPI